MTAPIFTSLDQIVAASQGFFAAEPAALEMEYTLTFRRPTVIWDGPQATHVEVPTMQVWVDREGNCHDRPMHAG